MDGIRLSPVLRHQSGVQYAREITIAAPAGILVAGVNNNRAYAEPANANREDNIWVVDLRAEKTVNIIGRTRARLFLDLFNMTNSHASETIGRATPGEIRALCLALLRSRAGSLGRRHAVVGGRRPRADFVDTARLHSPVAVR